MQNLLNDLTELLSKDERLSAEGKLLKNKVIELALAMDASLIKLLLKNEKIKKHFFTEVNGVMVFDKIKFQKFVSNKEFLPDSYTAFKNKIGLVNENGDYLSESREVVLSYPYKDCILEGDQIIEDQKRDEYFYNQILAPDEIDILLKPKVMVNWKYYDKKGKHELTVNEIKNINNENLVIRGNNLLVLHSLYARYAKKVRLIYIDPPYNTGNDEFLYNDTFNHSTWLTFMKNRLEVAKELLTDDGSIYVQLDYNEVHYAKVLMDEIFGKNNFKREIIWHLSGAAGYKSLVNSYVRGHDTILYYSKSDRVYFEKEYLPYNEDQLKRFKTDENGRKYKPITKDKCIYLDEAKGVPVSDVWLDIASFQTIVNSPEITGFKTQKPERLIKRIINSSSQPGDIVLDFTAGSGTTGATAHKLGRIYILVEQMSDQIGIITKRLHGVIKGDNAGISNDVNWKGGGSFIYCELMELNEAYIKQIKQATTTKELLAIWDEMQKKAFISYKVDPKSINENISDFKELSLKDQKRFLVEILDKNQLYVNYSEIDDKDYNISETDKKLNRMFYGEV